MKRVIARLIIVIGLIGLGAAAIASAVACIAFLADRFVHHPAHVTTTVILTGLVIFGSAALLLVLLAAAFPDHDR